MRAPNFWEKDRGTAFGQFVSRALLPVGNIYGNVTRNRADKPPEWTAPVPVICVGNAVMGGAGKTQVCLDILKRLKARGKRPHAITRGYGGKLKGPLMVEFAQHNHLDVGDEALLLARAAPTWIGSDRVASAKAATEADCLVMDDGLQNPSLAKTVSLLVVDGGYGFGNDRCFPAGPLREPSASAIERSDAVLVIGNTSTPLTIDTLGKPLFRGTIVATGELTDLKTKPVIAFSGIGRPQKFLETLGALNVDIRGMQAFPDHHPFKTSEVEQLYAAADAQECMLVTTEKDYVRLPDGAHRHVVPVPVAIEWEDNDAFEHFLLEKSGLN